ncbi:HD-GYP domain-containing protein [Brevibacillus laterosporus]|uniref:HD-GYP domain-containing protein n=1 Tax=Brevibacillus laterosporus TaxID=1465 RepID=A0A502IUA0_BRELA|nr:HD-GYP domain-containing protein [Brevibacillus laterosporus]TPG90481.1 HD-GYP domain-containing protein [Brevibacillus laterosporus]
MKLARSIYNSNGTILVGNGVTLTKRMIERLAEMNIHSIYIEDEETADIFIDDIISEQTRQEAMGFIHTSFETFRDDPKRFRQVFAAEKMGLRVKSVLTNLIHELKNNHSAMNLLGTVCGVDSYVFVHSFNVTIYTVLVGLKMGLNDKEIGDLALGAMLHDVGKMLIPPEILNKPGRLTDEEYEIVKQHTEIGFELLRKQIGIPLLTAHCAYQHHERIDGSGYPRQLKDMEIHPYAKILAVCDVFDALTSHRVYRSPMLPHDATELLFAGSGTQFCKNVLEEFRNSISVYPVGLGVTLSSGVSGVIIKNNPGLPSRPIVRILANEAHEKVNPFEVDLTTELSLVISDCEPLG